MYNPLVRIKSRFQLSTIHRHLVLQEEKPSETHVAAALIPAGNAVTKSAKRTPSGASCRTWESEDEMYLVFQMVIERTSKHKPCQSLIAGMFPTHRPLAHPTPVETFTFASRVQFAICDAKV
jgi:hypothetical protein